MSRENLREELIQVAAVAVAIVEDLDYVVAGNPLITRRVLDDVLRERVRQDGKWGPQSHDPFTWLMILMEEVGEVAEEIDNSGAEQYPFSVITHNQIIHAGQRAKAYLES